MATVLLGDVLSHGVCCEEWRSSRVFKSNLYLMVMCSRLFLLINQGSVAIVKYRSDFTLWPVLHYEQVRLLVLLPRTVFTVHSEYRKKNKPAVDCKSFCWIKPQPGNVSFSELKTLLPVQWKLLCHTFACHLNCLHFRQAGAITFAGLLISVDIWMPLISLWILTIS